MNKSLRKNLSLILTVVLAAGTITVPTAGAASGVNSGSGGGGSSSAVAKDVIETWTFDFGSGENVEEGSYSVKTDTHYNTNFVDDLQFGLLGTNEQDYKLASYVDGVDQQEGQVIVLSVSEDGEAIGAASQDVANYKVPGDYPIRFAMKAENNGYYRVTTTLTTLDDEKSAQANLFSERRHAIITEKTIAAGETETVTFTATVQNVAVKNRAAGTTDTYRDDMLNVVAVGDNLAVSEIKVEKVQPKTTIWMYDDSTGCDYAMLLPFFPYQNYGGTGQFMSKYLSEDIAIVNQGDGGINAADNVHWNCAKANIKEGDYIYVQYGHNHKDDGPLGYLKSLSKYYNHAVDKGANLILAGPIDRHNDGQYNSSTNTWSSTLGGFSKVAKYYAELIIVGGKDRADEFVTKATEAGGLTEDVYAWADSVIEDGITDSGATNVAFIDLNQPTLNWLSEVCETIKGIRNVDYYEKNASDYYFRITKGGSVDGTHPNDGGADNTASFFFDEAKKTMQEAETDAISAVEAAVLENLVADGREAEPYVISEEIVLAGKAGREGWPELYVPDNLPELPTEIKKIEFDEDGNIVSATVEKRSAKLDMSAYGIIVITVYNPDGTEKGKLYAVDQVDNTVNGAQTITNFRGDVTLGEDDTYKAVVLKATDPGTGIEVDEENPETYSAVFEPTEIETDLITDEDGNGTEDFDYYGAVYTGETVSNLSDYNSWIVGGSSGKTTTLGIDGERHYANFIATYGSSAYVMKKFGSSVGTTGRYMLEADLQYVSGSGMKVSFAGSIKASSPFASDEILLYTIGSNGSVTVNGTEAGALNTNSWATVRAILDMDAGTVSVSVAGGEPVTAEISNYAKYTSDITPSSLAGVAFNGSKANTGIRISNLTAAKLYDDKAKTTLNLACSDGSENMGSFTIGGEKLSSKSVLNGTNVTFRAVPEDGYVFKEWKLDGETFSTSPECTVRLYKDLSLSAVFAVATEEATVIVKHIDENGNELKASETYTEYNDVVLRKGDSFAIENDFSAVKKTNAVNSGYYDVYAYDSAKSDALTIDSVDVSNTINIVYSKLDGYFREYEEFYSVTDKTWGFTVGKDGNVSCADGVLYMLKNSGTSATGSDVKAFADTISGEKKITVGFDWVSGTDVTNKRSSAFDLTDTSGNVIFSLLGYGKNGTTYAVNATATDKDTKIANLSNQWIRVTLDIDFESKTLSGNLKNLSTGNEYTIAETEITAENLGGLTARYGYSAAPQSLDNFSVKIDELPAAPKAELAMSLETKENGEYKATVINGYDKAKDSEGVIAFVIYNADGSLCKIETGNAATETNTFTISGLTNDITTYSFKAMWFDSLDKLTPITAAVGDSLVKAD